MADRPTLTPKAERAIVLLGWEWDGSSFEGRGCFFQLDNGAVRVSNRGRVDGVSDSWTAFEVAGTFSDPSAAVLGYARGARLARQALDMSGDAAAKIARDVAEALRRLDPTGGTINEEAVDLLRRLAGAVEWL